MKVVDLDEELEGTKNADLLCSFGGRARLVEVKSASGLAPERAYQDLIRHLREWEQLPASTPVEGGALVMNHQHRLAPGERRRKPYERPEFLAAQTEPAITTLDLFAAWREEDADAVRRLLFQDLSSPVGDVTANGSLGGAEATPGRADGARPAEMGKAASPRCPRGRGLKKFGAPLDFGMRHRKHSKHDNCGPAGGAAQHPSKPRSDAG